jgi:hypothetical protein
MRVKKVEGQVVNSFEWVVCAKEEDSFLLLRTIAHLTLLILHKHGVESFVSGYQGRGAEAVIFICSKYCDITEMHMEEMGYTPSDFKFMVDEDTEVDFVNKSLTSRSSSAFFL